MSRRHHGRPRQHARSFDGPRPATGLSTGPVTGSTAEARLPGPPTQARPTSPPPQVVHDARPPEPAPAPVIAPSVVDHVAVAEHAPIADHAGSMNGAGGSLPRIDATPPPALDNVTPGPGNGAERSGQCTAPQLRRFIKSRPYVPMHELRRRFGIDGADDDVTPVRLDPGMVYIGLPNREGGLLGELLRSGDIGYELSLDPRTPIVIGVYPMRPIPRS